MRTYFVAITLLLAFGLAWVYPFIATVRGKSLLRTIVISWIASATFSLVLCFVAPMIVSAINPQFGNETFKTWVPQSRGAVMISILGWLPPLIAGGIGKLLHHVLSTFRTRRTSVPTGEGDAASETKQHSSTT